MSYNIHFRTIVIKWFYDIFVSVFNFCNYFHVFALVTYHWGSNKQLSLKHINLKSDEAYLYINAPHSSRLFPPQERKLTVYFTATHSLFFFLIWDITEGNIAGYSSEVLNLLKKACGYRYARFGKHYIINSHYYYNTKNWQYELNFQTNGFLRSAAFKISEQQSKPLLINVYYIVWYLD